MEEQKTKVKHGTPNNLDTKAAVEALEYLLAAGYVSKKRLYFANFMRGMFFAMGSVVGIAIVSTLVIGILSQFDDSPTVENLKVNVEKALDYKTNTPSTEDTN
jgi:hypothetical protein